MFEDICWKNALTNISDFALAAGSASCIGWPMVAAGALPAATAPKDRPPEAVLLRPGLHQRLGGVLELGQRKTDESPWHLQGPVPAVYQRTRIPV